MAPKCKIRESRNCVACGVEFQTTTKSPDKKYCSVRCACSSMGKANKTGRKPFFCKHCGKQHFPTSYQTLYCSRECAKAGRPKMPSTPAEVRFWAKVDKSGECWNWTASLTEKGYGVFHPTKQTLIIASRYAWELANGPIPFGLYVLHRCDNPRCVRADHLFLGTLTDNNRDMYEKARNIEGERHHWSKLSAASVNAIRARYAAGEGVTALAREFGVTHANVSLMVSGKSWKRINR